MEFLETAKTLIGWLVPAFAAVLWFIWQDMKSKVDKLGEEATAFKLHVAENYVNHTDLTEAMNGIKEVLGDMRSGIKSLRDDFANFSSRVYDKLDKKADKGSV